MNPADLYADEVLQQVVEAIRVGPVILAGEPGTAREAVARAALRLLDEREPLVLNPTRAGTLAALEADAAGRLVSILVSDANPVFSQLDPHQLRALQRHAGPEAPRLLATARGDGGAGLDVLLGLVEDGLSLVVRDAVQLRHRWAKDALWIIRARAADDDAPRTVLLSRPHESLTDTRDALLGAAETLTLRPPSGAMLVERLAALGIPVDAGAHWLSASRRLPAVVAAAVDHGNGDPAAGWSALVAATVLKRSVYERLAHEAHQLGPRLLDAIAHRRAPYASAPGASTALIANALAALRDVDLITQPSRRQWRIADPALEAVLAAPTAGLVPA